MKNIYKYLIVIFACIIVIVLGSIRLIKENKNDKILKDKIGQMLIIGFRGTEINDNSFIVKAIKDLNLGGVVLFDKDVPSAGEIPRNIINPEQTKKLVQDLKKISPLFISVDAEGGYINRLKEKYGFKNIPSAQEMGTGTPEKTKEYGNTLGEELADIGFNVDFAPVVDVNVNPTNPVIGDLERSFSANPKEVYTHASAFIDGLNENGIISAIKHFPGHGSSKGDSHLGMVDVTSTYKQEELLPYKNLIEGGYSDMVMTAHIVNTNIDKDFPATLSPLFLQNILRDQLSFKGIIVSDDMHMGAIVDNYGYNEALVKAVNAGCDMLIISNNYKTYDENSVYQAVNEIFYAVKSGKIAEARINDSYNRVLLLKEKFNIK